MSFELNWIGLGWVGLGWYSRIIGFIGFFAYPQRNCIRGFLPYWPRRESQTSRIDGKMEAALRDLERIQTQILERISKLELSHLPHNVEPLPSSSPLANADVEARLSNILRSNGVKDFLFKRVPSDYYDWPLESRRDVLGAASVHHLCKSIVLVCLFTVLLWIFIIDQIILFYYLFFELGMRYLITSMRLWIYVNLFNYSKFACHCLTFIIRTIDVRLQNLLRSACRI